MNNKESGLREMREKEREFYYVGIFTFFTWN